MLHIAMGCYRHYGSTVLPYYISLHITTVVKVSATCYYHHYGTTVLPYYIALHITTVVKVSATCHYKQGGLQPSYTCDLGYIAQCICPTFCGTFSSGIPSIPEVDGMLLAFSPS